MRFSGKMPLKVTKARFRRLSRRYRFGKNKEQTRGWGGVGGIVSNSPTLAFLMLKYFDL